MPESESRNDSRFAWCVDCKAVLGRVPSGVEAPAFLDSLVIGGPHKVTVVSRRALHAAAGDMTAVEALERLQTHRDATA